MLCQASLCDVQHTKQPVKALTKVQRDSLAAAHINMLWPFYDPPPTSDPLLQGKFSDLMCRQDEGPWCLGKPVVRDTVLRAVSLSQAFMNSIVRCYVAKGRLYNVGTCSKTIPLKSSLMLSVTHVPWVQHACASLFLHSPSQGAFHVSMLGRMPVCVRA